MITATYTWVPTLMYDPPPSTAIVMEQCTAGGYGYGQYTPSGAAADGFGDGQTEVYQGNSLTVTCAGFRYSVHSGATFQTTCSPSATVSGTNDVVEVSASYTANAHAVYISIWPFYGEITQPRVLVGQGVTASLNSFPLQAVSWDWGVSGGGPFKDYYVTPDSSAPSSSTIVFMGAENQSTCHFYYGKATDTSTITCSAHLAVPQGSNPAGGLERHSGTKCSG